MRYNESMRQYERSNGMATKAAPAVPPPVNTMAAMARPDQHAVDVASLHPLP